MKVSNELDAAIEKHGKVALPKPYEEEFKEQVLDAKARVAARNHI